MPGSLTGALLIDLEKGQGWERSMLPAHVPLLPQFSLRDEDILELRMRLYAAFEDQETFSLKVEPAAEFYRLGELGRSALMRTHLQVLPLVRRLATKVDLTEDIGDAYTARIKPLIAQVQEGEVLVEGVSLAFSVPRFKGGHIWQLDSGRNINFGVRHPDENAA